jgi:signal transduction histidine kinase
MLRHLVCSEFVSTLLPVTVSSVALQHCSAALLVCDSSGRVLGATPSAHQLLSSAGVDLTALPLPLAAETWSALSAAAPGEETHWRPDTGPELVISCVRHHLGDGWLLILSEVSAKQSELASRLHDRRLASLGRVVATAVHDLRAPLSSIVFGVDVLARDASALSQERAREIISDVRAASFCLRETIDLLLNFLRLGPHTATAVSIDQVLSRMQSLLRPQLRMSPHELEVHVSEDVRVAGNLPTLEQIFVNLVVNSLEAAARPTKVCVSTCVEGERLCVLVEDNGPGIPAEQRKRVFDPMFSTKEQGIGLGLTSARESARSVGGDLELVRWTNGASFAVYLPICASATTGVAP